MLIWNKLFYWNLKCKICCLGSFLQEPNMRQRLHTYKYRLHTWSNWLQARPHISTARQDQVLPKAVNITSSILSFLIWMQTYKDNFKNILRFVS